MSVSRKIPQHTSKIKKMFIFQAETGWQLPKQHLPQPIHHHPTWDMAQTPQPLPKSHQCCPKIPNQGSKPRVWRDSPAKSRANGVGATGYISPLISKTRGSWQSVTGILSYNPPSLSACQFIFLLHKVDCFWFILWVSNWKFMEFLGCLYKYI